MFINGGFTMKTNPVSEFWTTVADCSCEPNLFYFLKKKLVKQFRETINDSSETARAIDSNNTCSEISRIAEAEGHEDFAQAIGFAESAE